MARKKKQDIPDVVIPAAEIVRQPITETIEKNFMPYAMSVIVARAIPEIDGFKPSQRKLLYTMYKMGLLGGNRTKSANVVGQTMRLNPHGDAAIYETMVRLTRGNETLLHPFVDSKGSFGKHYSTDAYAAARYTEVRLDSICREIFSGIDRDAVDFVDNYDGTMKEPKLLPTTFPNILLSPSKGIAVAMSSSICSFNLAELCDATIQYLRCPETTVDQLLDILKAPDFQGGAYLVYNREQMREIYRTGRGSIRLRARWSYDKAANCIDVTQIPYSTTIEPIIKKVLQLIKDGKLREVSDCRDEIDVGGFHLTIDLRRGTDPEKLMRKLFRMTPLEDSFDCNFNVLINGVPRQLGVGEIIKEWIRFRTDCVQRELRFDLQRKRAKLHLLLGLSKILLDIDKAIRIVRQTENDQDVIPNLMAGFSIDEKQAEYVAEIKLRNLNREYILGRISETETLQKEIAELEELLSSDRKLAAYIGKQLKEVKAAYARPRQTQLLYDEDIPDDPEEDEQEKGCFRIFFTKGGFFKRISPLSLRGNDQQKLKDGDEIIVQQDADASDELLFFSDHARTYKAKVSAFSSVKSSELGEYVPAKLGFENGEKVVAMAVAGNYPPERSIVLFYAGGHAVRLPVSLYQTKTNRRCLTGGCSSASPLVAAFCEDQPSDVMLISSAGKALIFSTTLIAEKNSRDSRGAMVMTLKADQTVVRVLRELPSAEQCKRYRKNKLPSAGTVLSEPLFPSEK